MPFGSFSIVILIAIFLSIYPFPADIIEYMPSWILLVGLLFMYRLPLNFGLGWIFLCGLINDLLSQVYIGAEALLFVIVGMLFRSLMSYFSSSNGLGKMFLTSLFITIYELLRILLFAWLYGQDIFRIQYQPIFFSIVFSVILLSLLHSSLPRK